MNKKNFRPYIKPHFYNKKPLEYHERDMEMDKILLTDGENLPELNPDLKYKISLDTDYSGCYYPGDNPSIVCYIVGFSKKVVINPNYKKELEQYEKLKSIYNQECKQWKILKKEWDEEEEAKKIKDELNTLQKLKEKYEK